MQLSQAREKEIRSLRTRQGRRKSQKILVEGVRAIRTMLQVGVQPEYLVISPPMFTEIGRQFAAEQSDFALPIYECAEARFKKLADTVSSQGYLAVASRPQPAGTIEKSVGASRLILYLDGIRDPGNLGTITRTAAAFGVDLIALSPETADAFNPKTIRASAGLVFAVQLREIDKPEAFFDLLESNQIEVYGTAADGDTEINEVKLAGSACLAVGSEAAGLSDPVSRRCRKILAIRTSAIVESLNVSVAVAIAVHALARRLELL